MFPDAFIDNESLTDDNEIAEENGVDFVFDYTKGEHILKGTVEVCDKIESVRQYVQNVLRIPYNTYKVYTEGETESFGLSIFSYIGKKNIPMGYVNSELKREVTELLTKHPYISEVTKWSAQKAKKGLQIQFTVILSDDSEFEITEELPLTEATYV